MRDMPRLREMLEELIRAGGSDLHLSAGSAPIIRLHGRLQPYSLPPLTVDELTRLLREALPDEQFERFEAARDLDFVWEVPGLGRFRGNAFLQHRGPSAVFRVVPQRVPTADELGL